MLGSRSPSTCLDAGVGRLRALPPTAAVARDVPQWSYACKIYRYLLVCVARGGGGSTEEPWWSKKRNKKAWTKTLQWTRYLHIDIHINKLKWMPSYRTWESHARPLKKKIVDPHQEILVPLEKKNVPFITIITLRYCSRREDYYFV